jgi:hypothetical protein
MKEKQSKDQRRLRKKHGQLNVHYVQYIRDLKKLGFSTGCVKSHKKVCQAGRELMLLPAVVVLYYRRNMSASEQGLQALQLYNIKLGRVMFFFPFSS